MKWPVKLDTALLYSRGVESELELCCRVYKKNSMVNSYQILFSKDFYNDNWHEFYIIETFNRLRRK